MAGSLISVAPAASPFSSSIGRKSLVAFSGLVLVVFLVIHTIGNLMIFLGADALNRYAHTLHSLPYGLAWFARATLLGALLLHVALAVRLHVVNRRVAARGYAVRRYLAASRASLIMMPAGGVILLFLVLHILHFTTRSFGSPPPMTRLADVALPVVNVYAMVYGAFSDPVVAIAYLVALAAVAVHLLHGVASAIQSLGFGGDRRMRLLHRFSRAIAVFVVVGLGAVPLAVGLDAWAGMPLFDRAALGGVR